MKRTEFICAALGSVLGEELDLEYRSSCCIESCRITEMVLDLFHIPSRPLATSCSVFNPQLVAWVKAGGDLSTLAAEEMDKFGGWVVKIGDTGELKEAGWDGHLATIVEERLLVDLTIKQANRPHKNITVTPVVYPVKESFLCGEEALAVEHKVSGCFLRYVPIKKPDYVSTPAWSGRLSEKRVIADRVLWKIDRMLKRSYGR